MQCHVWNLFLRKALPLVVSTYCPTWDSLELTEKNNLNWVIVFIRLVCGHTVDPAYGRWHPSLGKRFWTVWKMPAKHEYACELASEQASGNLEPASRFPPGFLQWCSLMPPGSCLTSFSDVPWSASASEINPFLPRMLLVRVLKSDQQKETRTDWWHSV